MFDLSRIARGMGFALLVTFLLMLASSAGAQQAGNLLVNGHMEGGFSERDGVIGVPLGWVFYAVAGSPDADRQQFAPYAYSAPTFWVIRSAYETWVAGGMQTVQVTPGITYRFGAYVFIWTCNDAAYYCTHDQNPRFSNQESNARARVGIDPNGGVDPNSPAIVWGPWVQSFDRYQGITVDATAVSSNITVFLQGDSGQAMAFNEIYWDSASLVPITTAPVEDPVAVNNPAAAANTGNSAPPPVSPSEFVPFVNPQQARPDGSVVHIVQAGDTFLSILVAYDSLGISRDSVMALNGWRWEPDFINIGDEMLILPPGSVDPATGRVVTGGAAPAQPQTESVAVQPGALPAETVTETQPNNTLRTISLAELAAVPPVESITPFLPQ